MSKTDLEKLFHIQDTTVSSEIPNTPNESKVNLETNKESIKVSSNKKGTPKKNRSMESKNKEKAHKELLAKKQKVMKIKIENHMATSTKSIIRELLTVDKPIIYTVVNDFTGKKHRFKITTIKR